MPRLPDSRVSTGTVREFLASMHCPSLDIFGTFFPSWMLCSLIGIAGAVIAFKICSALKVDRWIGPKLVFYPSIAIAVTSLTWFGWYGH